MRHQQSDCYKKLSTECKLKGPAGEKSMNLFVTFCSNISILYSISFEKITTGTSTFNYCVLHALCLIGYLLIEWLIIVL